MEDRRKKREKLGSHKLGARAYAMLDLDFKYDWKREG
jgi:hypothetical protein